MIYVSFTSFLRNQEGYMTQLTLLQPEPSRVPLDAYLACALTALGSEQRQLIFHISDMIANVCVDHHISVYEPRKKTDPVFNPEVADIDVFMMDRDRVLASDLLILLTHYPSFGA